MEKRKLPENTGDLVEIPQKKTSISGSIISVVGKSTVEIMEPFLV